MNVDGTTLSAEDRRRLNEHEFQPYVLDDNVTPDASLTEDEDDPVAPAATSRLTSEEHSLLSATVAAERSLVSGHSRNPKSLPASRRSCATKAPSSTRRSLPTSGRSSVTESPLPIPTILPRRRRSFAATSVPTILSPVPSTSNVSDYVSITLQQPSTSTATIPPRRVSRSSQRRRFRRRARRFRGSEKTQESTRGNG